MKALVCFVLTCAFSSFPLAADPIPPELVGEWVSPDAKFSGQLLAKGSAIYLDTNGFVAMIGAPPPIGMAGTAVYDPKRFILTLNLHDNGKPPERAKIVVIYDPKAKTLSVKPGDDILAGTFKRRKNTIPKWVRQMRID